MSLKCCPAILEIVDPNQFGTMVKFSCSHALVSMLHTWAQATKGTDAAVRIIQLNYRKAFDLIDHQTLVNKVLSLHIPWCVARWVCDILMDRQQRVKLSNNYFSEWGPVPSGVPEGTKLAPWLFVFMINDLRCGSTSIIALPLKDGVSGIQEAVDSVALWSHCNKLQLNVDNCKD